MSVIMKNAIWNGLVNSKIDLTKNDIVRLLNGNEKKMSFFRELIYAIKGDLLPLRNRMDETERNQLAYSLYLNMQIENSKKESFDSLWKKNQIFFAIHAGVENYLAVEYTAKILKEVIDKIVSKYSK